jgi:hypothetical protein
MCRAKLDAVFMSKPEHKTHSFSHGMGSKSRHGRKVSNRQYREIIKKHTRDRRSGAKIAAFVKALLEVDDE